jgi:hypothetical protein
LGDGQGFTIEKASRYFDVDERPKNYHSIIYSDDSVNHGKFRVKRDVHEDEADHGCGLTKEVKSKMELIQNSGEFGSQAQSVHYNETIKMKSHLSPDHEM